MFHDFIEKFMQVYIDDIVAKSSSEDDHLNHLRQSFERMRQYRLKMNTLKCAFGVCAGDFVGFVVHKKGIEINQNKTKAIMETKAPSTKKELPSVEKNQFSQKIYIESMWQNTSFFAITSAEERRCVQVGTRAPKGF